MPVFAQDDATHMRSNALFDAGKRLLAEGSVAAACESFSRSQQLEPRGGTLLNLGLCHERQGRLLAARRELLDALAIARRDARADREPVATEHIAAIEARLAWLTIVPASHAPELPATLRLDSEVIAPEAGERIPVEAGRHVVSLEADGFERVEASVQVSAGEQRNVTLGPLRSSVSEAHHEVVSAPPEVVATASTAQPYATPRLVALIVGTVGLAAGLVTGAIALQQKSVVAEHCDEAKRCDARGLSAAATGLAMTVTSNIAFATGVVGVGVWVALPGGWLNPDRAQGLSVRGVF
jgi:hypothetical protein